MNLDDPKIIAALISAIVSLVITVLAFILKVWFERNFLIFKLDAEHQYEQKKEIKKIIAKYKTHLIDAAETLNHRLWNFANNYPENWHRLTNTSRLLESYYLFSFTYRFLAFFAWSHKIEKEMVYLDTTIASRSDLNSLKFLKFFNQLMCETDLFNGLQYRNSSETDHLFRNNFENICESFWNETGVISYSEFEKDSEEYIKKTTKITEFLNGVNPKETRLRWDRLQAIHYALLMFLNTYGYDFQYTDKTKIKSLMAKSPRPNKTIDNLRHMLSRLHLDHLKEVKSILAILEKVKS